MEHLESCHTNGVGTEELRLVDVCKDVRFYGKCADKLTCKAKTHVFTKQMLSGNSTVPKFKTGRVDLKILKCVEVNHYLAQVLNFYETQDGKKKNNISYMNILRERHRALNTYYMEMSNRKCLSNPSVGDICGIELHEDEYLGFTRAKISRILNLEGSASFRVWCVDLGLFKILHADQLFILPDRYMDVIGITVNVILADIKPLNGYNTFGHKGEVAKLKLMDKVLVGKVCLSMENTIWVKSLADYQKAADGGWVQSLNARTEFLKDQLVAEDNSVHLKMLYNLCEDVGFSCSSYDAVEVVGPEFQRGSDFAEWAFLQTSGPCNPVMIKVVSTFIESPDKIYVIQEKFERLLNNLIVELNQQIEMLIEVKYQKYESTFANHYVKSLCIAAKDPENSWARAVITNRHVSKQDGKILFDVFFVDHGDSLSDLTLKEVFPLPRKFVDRLPFQVIALKLNHVEPMNGSESAVAGSDVRIWSEEAIDHTRDQLLENDASKTFDVVTTSKNTIKTNLDLPTLPCMWYNAYVFAPSDIGETLVKANLAKPKPALYEEFEEARTVLLNRFNQACHLAKLLAETQIDDDEPQINEEDFVGFF